MNTYSVFCEKVTVHFEDADHAEFIYTAEKPLRSERVDKDSDLTDIQCQIFINAILNKGTEVCSVTEGLRSLLLVEGINKSSEQGGVMLPYDL